MEKTQKLERIQLWKEYKLERDKTDKWRSITNIKDIDLQVQRLLRSSQ